MKLFTCLRSWRAKFGRVRARRIWLGLAWLTIKMFYKFTISLNIMLCYLKKEGNKETKVFIVFVSAGLVFVDTTRYIWNEINNKSSGAFQEIADITKERKKTKKCLKWGAGIGMGWAMELWYGFGTYGWCLYVSLHIKHQH